LQRYDFERPPLTVAGPDRKLCRYHDPALKAATIERNRTALRRYWERYRAAKALPETDRAPGDGRVQVIRNNAQGPANGVLIAPEVLEASRGQLSISDGVLDAAVA
jgi:hypothetical protein